MRITRNTVPTVTQPKSNFTGLVYADRVAEPIGPSQVHANAVYFTPGSRTNWHTHPNGQTIYVVEGVGVCQRRGGPVEVIRPGDRVFFEPGQEHWHGAHPKASCEMIDRLSCCPPGKGGSSMRAYSLDLRQR
ncbi:MAG: hypothetical protein DCC58_07155, partial [Chloroflexi bacterium]